jgi:hypothetical protein
MSSDTDLLMVQVETLLADPSPGSEALDDALTECAAHTLWMGAELVRAERLLHMLQVRLHEGVRIVQEADRAARGCRALNGDIEAFTGLIERLRARRMQLEDAA